MNINILLLSSENIPKGCQHFHRELNEISIPSADPDS